MQLYRDSRVWKRLTTTFPYISASHSLTPTPTNPPRLKYKNISFNSVTIAIVNMSISKFSEYVSK